MVSSTISNLTNEREAAYRAIRSLGFEPSMSEKTFGAKNIPSIDACIEAVKNCDYYLLILGDKYGFVYDEKNQESVTKLEWKTAVKEEKPILVFVANKELEPLQQSFLQEVGDFFEGKHFATFDTAFDLQDLIIDSINKLVIDQERIVLSGKEEVISNLIKVNIPEEIYVMPLDSIPPKRRFQSDRARVWKALQSKKIESTNEWITKDDSIYSFLNLKDSTVPITQIGFTEYTESHDISFFNSDPIKNKYVAELLMSCLQNQLYEGDPTIKWLYDRRHKHKQCFYFDCSKDMTPITIKWGEANKEREVFGPRESKNSKTKKIYTYYRHLAFKPRFYFIQNSWYLAINPTWYFTYDGSNAERFSSEKISTMKRLENNASVKNHVRFWIWFLTHNKTDLFDTSTNNGALSFHKIEKMSLNYSIKDEEWLKKEPKEKKKRLEQIELL